VKNRAPVKSRLVVQTLLGPADPIDPRADMVELRLDLYDPFEPETQKPVIHTVRRERDGGRFAGSEQERRELLGHPPYIDLEVDAPFPAPERFLVSAHDLEGVPDDLDGLFERCLERGGELVKVAATPRSAVEAFRLLELPTPGIGMGPYGEFTRVLAPLTYCANAPVAPGMLTPAELFDVYRIRRLSGSPALFGVAGDPIAHSQSPRIHNEIFESAGRDAVYVRFKVKDLDSFWPVFLAHGGRGLSVTAPLKLQAAAIAERPAEEVQRCGAANTLLSDGRAQNTDYRAFLDLVPRGSGDALVLGAGGAARAAIAALGDLGYDVKVWARNPGGLEADFVPEPFGAPVIVNTTPLDPPKAPLLIDLRYGPGRDAGLGFLETQARYQAALFLELA